MYIVYILHSESTSKYYTGQTDNLENRLKRHNSGLSLSTKSGKPWGLIYQIGFSTRSEAMNLEQKIKKRGAKRYLLDNNIIDVSEL
jgi:putative endonuclease